MALVIPAIRCKMGSTTYYEAKMRVRDLAANTRPAGESDKWANVSIEERIQRDLNKTRVRDQIVPYLMRDDDRLFGSVLVLAENGLEFESFSRYANGDIPAAQRAAAEDLGLLNVVDNGDLVVLDGQHRMAALRHVLTAEHPDEADAAKAREIGRDEIAVIFFESTNTEKIRRLFNKINRQAKPATRADNIITSEDDGFAIVTRRLMRVSPEPGENGPLGITYPPNGDLFVEWKTNTVADGGFKLTTMSAIYESVKDIVPAEGIEMIEERKGVVRPDEKVLDKATEVSATWWRKMLAGLTPLRLAAQDPTALPDLRLTRKHKLLLKPNGQQALVKGLARGKLRGGDLDTMIARAEQVDWGTPEIWQDVLMKANGNMIARSENYKVAADLIAYLVASEHTSAAQRKETNLAYADIRGEHKDLPRDEVPDCLPDPIV